MDTLPRRTQLQHHARRGAGHGHRRRGGPGHLHDTRHRREHRRAEETGRARWGNEKHNQVLLRGALGRSCLNFSIFLKLAQCMENVNTNYNSSKTFFEIFIISGYILSKK